MKKFINKRATLTPETYEITACKATEAPSSSKKSKKLANKTGIFICRNCGQSLFASTTKFNSGTGWPSFDEAITDHVIEKMETDGSNRTEIICSQCCSHLGHVFKKEGFTKKQTRHCVNSKAIEYTSNPDANYTEEAILALGCFWKPQLYFEDIPGVLITEVGYTGGHIEYPSYRQVCSKKSGHFEAIRIVFSPKITSYLEILDLFFQYHDTSQKDGQGCDIGDQYKSAIFYHDENQKTIALNKINKMKCQDHVATQLLKADIFWPAEDYHQHYLREQAKR